MSAADASAALDAEIDAARSSARLIDRCAAECAIEERHPSIRGSRWRAGTYHVSASAVLGVVRERLCDCAEDLLAAADGGADVVAELVVDLLSTTRGE